MAAVRIEGNASRHVTITGNILAFQDSAVHATNGSSGVVISGNRMSGSGVLVSHASFSGAITGNDIHQQYGDEPAIHIDAAADDIIIDGNHCLLPARDGIVLTGASNCLVANNLISRPGGGSSNTRDGIRIDGGERNYVHGNKIVPLTGATVTRYGVNIAAGDCHIVVGNDLGDPADYGTDALNDAGTGTQLTYPADPTYGDNFADCVTSP